MSANQDAAFDEKYDAAIEEMTEACYKLSVVYADEMIHRFAKWLQDKSFLMTGPASELAEEFIRENRE